MEGFTILIEDNTRLLSFLKNDCAHFLQRLIKQSSGERHKLSVYVTATKSNNTGDDGGESLPEPSETTAEEESISPPVSTTFAYHWGSFCLVSKQRKFNGGETLENILILENHG